jgi:hypothetical protein
MFMYVRILMKYNYAYNINLLLLHANVIL